ncbi:hypothetical protein C7M84_008755 [Penaeus vannamei]|uniref:Uncharacterized protein n=1 Tax=Penaeus vannamei TaxID=6689 RepID=A0A3R7M4P9_PENVA|nr:hypothetical protein C7M84_008755 [Penaeus vannamei]
MAKSTISTFLKNEDLIQAADVAKGVTVITKQRKLANAILSPSACAHTERKGWAKKADRKTCDCLGMQSEFILFLHRIFKTARVFTFPPLPPQSSPGSSLLHSPETRKKSHPVLQFPRYPFSSSSVPSSHSPLFPCYSTLSPLPSFHSSAFSHALSSLKPFYSLPVSDPFLPPFHSLHLPFLLPSSFSCPSFLPSFPPPSINVCLRLFLLLPFLYPLYSLLPFSLPFLSLLPLPHSSPFFPSPFSPFSLPPFFHFLSLLLPPYCFPHFLSTFISFTLPLSLPLSFIPPSISSPPPPVSSPYSLSPCPLTLTLYPFPFPLPFLSFFSLPFLSAFPPSLSLRLSFLTLLFLSLPPVILTTPPPLRQSIPGDWRSPCPSQSATGRV